MPKANRYISLRSYRPQVGESAWECFDTDGALCTGLNEPDVLDEFLEKAVMYSNQETKSLFMVTDDKTNDVLGVAFKGQLIR